MSSLLSSVSSDDESDFMFASHPGRISNDHIATDLEYKGTISACKVKCFGCLVNYVKAKVTYTIKVSTTQDQIRTCENPIMRTRRLASMTDINGVVNV